MRIFHSIYYVHLSNQFFSHFSVYGWVKFHFLVWENADLLIFDNFCNSLVFLPLISRVLFISCFAIGISYFCMVIFLFTLSICLMVCFIFSYIIVARHVFLPSLFTLKNCLSHFILQASFCSFWWRFVFMHFFYHFYPSIYQVIDSSFYL